MNAAICAVCLKMYHQITLNERVCQGCLADAKLGRMVRGMPEGCGLYHHVGGYFTGRFEGEYSRGNATPEEALEKAMGEWK